MSGNNIRRGDEAILNITSKDIFNKMLNNIKSKNDINQDNLNNYTCIKLIDNDMCDDILMLLEILKKEVEEKRE